MMIKVTMSVQPGIAVWTSGGKLGGHVELEIAGYSLVAMHQNIAADSSSVFTLVYEKNA